MNTIHSYDGTEIAYWKLGGGPPVILVDGALCYREVGASPKLAGLLSETFGAVHYDRRGRGESGERLPYAIERELEDLQALIDAVGGSAYLWGISSGAALALEAAAHCTGVEKLALYELALSVGDDRPRFQPGYVEELNALLAADRRADAVRLFLKQVGVPSFAIGLMRFLPAWSKLKSAAPTLPYDYAVMDVTQEGKSLRAERWSSVTIPTMCSVGGKSPAWMHHGMEALAQALPNAELRVLDGQTHVVKPKVLAPLLTEFFTGGEPSETAGRRTNRMTAA